MVAFPLSKSQPWAEEPLHGNSTTSSLERLTPWVMPFFRAVRQRSVALNINQSRNISTKVDTSQRTDKNVNTLHYKQLVDDGRLFLRLLVAQCECRPCLPPPDSRQCLCGPLTVIAPNEARFHAPAIPPATASKLLEHAQSPQCQSMTKLSESALRSHSKRQRIACCVVTWTVRGGSPPVRPATADGPAWRRESRPR